jgi:hypothetical protein
MRWGILTLVDTSNWSLKNEDGRYLLDLEWKGLAKTDITFGKFYVGGLFIRMPGLPKQQVKSLMQQDCVIWLWKVSAPLVGYRFTNSRRDDWGHMAII